MSTTQCTRNAKLFTQCQAVGAAKSRLAYPSPNNSHRFDEQSLERNLTSTDEGDQTSTFQNKSDKRQLRCVDRGLDVLSSREPLHYNTVIASQPEPAGYASVMPKFYGKGYHLRSSQIPACVSTRSDRAPDQVHIGVLARKMVSSATNANSLPR